MPLNAPPLLNKRALLQLGWTPALITSILVKPDKVEHHRKGLCHWVEHLYTRDRVDQGMQDARFLAAVGKRRQRAAAADRRRAEIPKRYPEWQAALPEAAAAMFSLNRYAKHRQCSELQKVEIYQLKNELIELLYRNGYCTAAWIHLWQQEEQICRECDGAGDIECSCGGTGVWRPARTLEFWCFRFLIEDCIYCWHQPRRSVEFTPVESVPPQDWEGIAGEKPVSLPVRKFASVKALLRWVLDAAVAAQENKEDLPFEFSPPAGESSPPASAPLQDSLFSGL